MTNVSLISAPINAGIEILKFGRFNRKLDVAHESAASVPGLLSILEDFQGYSSLLTLDHVFVSMLIESNESELQFFRSLYNSQLHFISSIGCLLVTGSLGSWKLAIMSVKDLDLPFELKEILYRAYLVLVGELKLTKIFNDCVSYLDKDGSRSLVYSN